MMKSKLLIASLLATISFSTSSLAGNLLETMSDDGGFKILLKAIKTAGMEDTFKGNSSITVFAPTDFAFDGMPKEKRDALLADKDALKKLISHHVVPIHITKADVDAGKVKAMDGQELSLSVAGGVKISNVSVVGTGINADNGVIHALNTIITP